MHAMTVYVYVCIKWKRCDAVRAATERKLHKFAYRPKKIVATFKCVSGINLEISVYIVQRYFVVRML